jgi:hypothetical protein
LISGGQGARYTPSIAFDGTNYLVAWQDERFQVYITDIFGARVTKSGVVLDTAGIPVSRAYGNQEYVTIAFDGQDYIAVWEDCRSSSSRDIYGARIAPSGAIVDSFPVSVQTGDQFAPNLGCGLNRQTLITYSSFVTSINNRSAFAMRVWGKFYPFVGIGETVISGCEREGPRLTVRPNPFGGVTQITYDLGPDTKEATLGIYGLDGRVVRSLTLQKGPCSRNAVVRWDGCDDSGRSLPAGVYFCRLKTKKSWVSKKLVKLK